MKRPLKIKKEKEEKKERKKGKRGEERKKWKREGRETIKKGSKIKEQNKGTRKKNKNTA